jgi:hypothetical protein
MENSVNRKLEDFLEDYEDLREYKEMKEKLKYTLYTLDELVELGRKVDSLYIKSEVEKRHDILEANLIAYVDIDILRELIKVKKEAYDETGLKVGESKIRLVTKEMVN